LPKGGSPNPFVSVETDLDPKRRITTDTDGQVTPVLVNDLEMVMVD
jgi:hypothetical protein